MGTFNLKDYKLVDGIPVPCKEGEMGKPDKLFSDRFQTDSGEVHVSTVFLGFNHSFSNGPPILFETMVFGGEHDSYQNRYVTLEEARLGHNHVIENVLQIKSTIEKIEEDLDKLINKLK